MIQLTVNALEKTMLKGFDLNKGIITGVIAGLLIMNFFQPILLFTGKTIIGLSSVVWDGFSNRLYRSAALGYHEKYSFFTLGLFIYLVPLIFYIFYSMNISKIKDKLKTMDLKIAMVDSEKAGTDPNSTGEEDINEVKNQKNLLDKELKKLAIKLNTLTWVLILLCLLFLSTLFADYTMNLSFNQRLTVLAPAISDSEIKQIKAKWASMESRENYESIVNQMDELAKSNNIELPKLRWE